MWYKVLIDKNNLSEALFANAGEYSGRVSYEAAWNYFNIDISNWNIERPWYSFTLFKFTNLTIAVTPGFIGVINEEGLINLIVVKEDLDNNLFIDKSFERDYPVLYKRFKPIIQEYSDKKFDITYTNYCGRTKFLEFEKPKFSTIKERDEFVNSLLDEVYN